MPIIQPWRQKAREIRKLHEEETQFQEQLQRNNEMWDTAFNAVIKLGTSSNPTPISQRFFSAAALPTAEPAVSYADIARNMAQDMLKKIAASLENPGPFTPYEAIHIQRRFKETMPLPKPLDGGISDALQETEAIVKDYLRDPKPLKAAEEKSKQFRETTMPGLVYEAMGQYLQDNPWAVHALKEMTIDGGLWEHAAVKELGWHEKDTEVKLKGIAEDVNSIYSAGVQSALIRSDHGRYRIEGEDPALLLIRKTPRPEDGPLMKFMQDDPLAVRLLQEIGCHISSRKCDLQAKFNVDEEKLQSMVTTVNGFYGPGHQVPLIEVQDDWYTPNSRRDFIWDVIRATPGKEPAMNKVPSPPAEMRPR
jgi:hypothetical protein